MGRRSTPCLEYEVQDCIVAVVYVQEQWQR
jgi:hypothetical protein